MNPSEEFQAIIEDVARREGIKNPKLELQSSSHKGDGYLGMIKFGKIVGANKTLEIVLKCSHRDPKAFAELNHVVYLNEITFYDTIVPAFKQFQQEHNIFEPFDNTAQFYGAVDEVHKETLVLEDLKMKNFHMWDRKRLMNDAHLTCALQTFAKFHSISFAMQQLKPEVYQNISGSLQKDTFYRMLDDMKFFAQLETTMRNLFVVFDQETREDRDYLDKIKAATDNTQKEMEEAFGHHVNDVILQGDCWCANALYQYEDGAEAAEREVPKNMKMLDFQLCMMGSPVMDVAYFFYAAAPKVAFDRLEHFLRVYHNALTGHLEKFQLRAEEVFSFDQLISHWRKVAKFGLFMTAGVRKVMFVESQDAPDFTENSDDFLDKLVMNPETEKLYHQQMRELIIHFVDHKFI